MKELREYKINIAQTPVGNKAIKEFIEKWKLTISGLSMEQENNIKFHEERYRRNMEYENYHAAENHIRIAIQLRCKNIIRKHCG